MKVFSFFNTFILYILVVILLFSYYYEFIIGDAPCSLCILQRFFLVGIGVPLMFNVFGVVSYKNIGASILSCMLGSIVSLYQWAELLMNDGISYAPHLLSLPIYICAALIFFALALYLFALLFFMKEGVYFCSNFFVKLGYALFILMVISEIVVTFRSCGLFLC